MSSHRDVRRRSPPHVFEARRDMSEGCDSWALANGWVSVTPLGLLSAVALPVRTLF